LFVICSIVCMAEPENDAHHALLAGIANEASSGDDTAVEAASAEASEAASEDVAVASEAAAEAVSEGAEAAPEDERLQCAAAAQFTLLAGEEAVAEVDFTGEVSWEALVLDEAPHFDIDVRVTCRSFDAPDDWQVLVDQSRERELTATAGAPDAKSTLRVHLSNVHSWKNPKTLSLRISLCPGGHLISSRLPAEDELRQAVVAAVQGTFLKKDQKLNADTLNVLQVQRVQDASRLHDYACVLEQIAHQRSPDDLATRSEQLAVKTHQYGLPCLKADCCESWLFHGTSEGSADAIARNGFDKSRIVGVQRHGTLFGGGVYFSECSSKADLYGVETATDNGKQVYCMLLCRVALGHFKTSHDLRPDKEGLQRCVESGQFDSVLGDRERLQRSYREFVVQNPSAVYPEFIVRYERTPATVFQRWKRHHFGETNFWDVRVNPD